MPSLDMMKEKPLPRGSSPKSEIPKTPEKPRTARSIRTARPKRPTLRTEAGSAASEAEKQVTEIRSKLKSKEAAQHPDALSDAWEALRNFYHPGTQPSEKDLHDLRQKLQTALYEYQARLEKIPTLRLPKTLKAERSEDFEGQREQLEKILGELMDTENPAQAKQDSVSAFNNYAEWKAEQSLASIKKSITNYEKQNDDLLEQEFALREEIEAIAGGAIMGNTAEEIRANLKLSGWQKVKAWLGTIKGKKPVMQLINDLEQIQGKRDEIAQQVRKLETTLNPEQPTTADVRARRASEQQNFAEGKTHAEAIKDFGLEDIAESEHGKMGDLILDFVQLVKKSVTQNNLNNTELRKLLGTVRKLNPKDEQTSEFEDINRLSALISTFQAAWRDMSYKNEKPLENSSMQTAVRQINDWAKEWEQKSGINLKERSAAKQAEGQKTNEQDTDEEWYDTDLSDLISEQPENVKQTAQLTEGTEELTTQDIISDNKLSKQEQRQMKLLEDQLGLLQQARAEMIEEIGMETETREEVMSDLRNWGAISDYDKQIAALQKQIAELNKPEEELEELEPEPEETISSEAPPPPSAEERERRLDLQAAISGMPRRGKKNKPTLKAVRSEQDQRDLEEQLAEQSENIAQATEAVMPAEQFELPKKYTKKQPAAKVIAALESQPVSTEGPTARGKKELPDAYIELQTLINAQLGLLPKEDRMALNFDTKAYAEKAMMRDRAYATGNDNEGNAYQKSIDELNKELNRAGVIGDNDDPSISTGGKSGGFNVLGSDAFTRRLDSYTKVIPTARRTRSLEKAARVETKEAAPLSIYWAKAILGEKAESEFSRVAPIIAERDLGKNIMQIINKMVNEVNKLDLSNTSKDYQALPSLLEEVNSNPKYASSPEASIYVLLNAFKPVNAADIKVQDLIDKAIKNIDIQLLNSKEAAKQVTRSFMEKSAASKQARERQEAVEFVLNQKKKAEQGRQAKEVAEQFLAKQRKRTAERALKDLAEGNNKYISIKDRKALTAKVKGNEKIDFDLAIDEYIEALKSNDTSSLEAKQDRLREIATANGLENEPAITQLLSRYEKPEVKAKPKTLKKPKTARSKRTAR